ncbi:MAG TPA: VWA domain-containing protein [Terriglobales bacterium]|nr:VWA domain-containing protein [Terriglobales bacterium]
MSSLPGQRTVLLVSPGFLLGDRHFDSVEVMDRAIRSKVTINALDARGLYVDSALKADYSGPVSFGLLDYQRQSDRLRADALQALANATGGTFVHNTNDLGGGMRQLAAPPEYTYILAFSPQALKHDGKYHTLKVTLTEPDLKVTARQGYYAPKGSTDPEQARRRDIEDMLFSRQEIREIPIKLHSEFFKSAATVKLSVVSRVDVTSLAFRKEAGRNCDDVTVVSALFDRNGKLIDGIEKIIELRLRDKTLEDLHSGLSVRSSFDVNPGKYVVRVVVRDAEGRKLSAASTAIDIP